MKGWKITHLFSGQLILPKLDFDLLFWAGTIDVRTKMQKNKEINLNVTFSIIRCNNIPDHDKYLNFFE